MQDDAKPKAYRHKKRGTTYVVIGEAELQDATGLLCDGAEMVIYRGENGQTWVRHKDEFHDGRFEEIEHPPAPAQPADVERVARSIMRWNRDYGPDGFPANATPSDYEMAMARAALAAMPVGEPVQELLELSADAVDRQEAADKAATFCIEQLASMLGDPDYVQADGSEEWEGDVSGTIYNVLVAAKIIDDEDGSVASHATPPADADARLVEQAFREGHLCGRRGGDFMSETDDWKKSKSRASLTAKEV